MQISDIVDRHGHPCQQSFKSVTFYRPQRSWGKVIFSEACVNNSVHRGEGACVVAWGGMHGCTGGDAWFYSGGMHGFIRGACMVLFGGACMVLFRGACMVLFGGHA